MNWTLDQLTAFVTAAESGSFSSAARKMGKAQSRISTAIANLEIDLGFELFDRSGKMPVLTSNGEDMLQDAKAILAQCQRMNSRAMIVTAGEPVSITVALDEAVPVESFELLFESLANRFPNLKVTILNGSQDDIANWVEDGRADIGFLFRVKPLSGSLEWYDITNVKQCLIVSPHHELASETAPSEDTLVKHRQLVIRDRLGYSQEPPVSPLYWHIDSYYYISTLVMRGLGWAYVPEHIARHEWHESGLAILSTDEVSSPPTMTLCAVKTRERGWDKVISWMDEQLQTSFG